MEDDILTIEEVAKYLRVSERTVYDWAQKGEIPSGKIGTVWRFKKSEIEKYAEYIADHKDDIITRTDLRNLNYVHNAKFKKFFDEHLDEIKEELEVNYSLLLYPYEGGNKSMKAYQVIKKG